MVSSKVLLIGIKGHGLPFCGQNERPKLPGLRLPFVQLMNMSPCWIYVVKSRLCLIRKPEIGFLLGVSCARFLVCPIINNTITKTCFLSHSFINILEGMVPYGHLLLAHAKCWWPSPDPTPLPQVSIGGPEVSVKKMPTNLLFKTPLWGTSITL